MRYTNRRRVTLPKNCLSATDARVSRRRPAVFEAVRTRDRLAMNCRKLLWLGRLDLRTERERAPPQRLARSLFVYSALSLELRERQSLELPELQSAANWSRPLSAAALRVAVNSFLNPWDLEALLNARRASAHDSVVFSDVLCGPEFGEIQDAASLWLKAYRVDTGDGHEQRVECWDALSAFEITLRALWWE